MDRAVGTMRAHVDPPIDKSARPLAADFRHLDLLAALPQNGQARNSVRLRNEGNKACRGVVATPAGLRVRRGEHASHVLYSDEQNRILSLRKGTGAKAAEIGNVNLSTTWWVFALRKQEQTVA
jgi:hypothetical protein